MRAVGGVGSGDGVGVGAEMRVVAGRVGMGMWSAGMWNVEFGRAAVECLVVSHDGPMSSLVAAVPEVWSCPAGW